MRVASCFTALCMVLSGGSAAQVRPGEALVEAELLADVSAIRPGQTFHVGVLFAARSGWHIYWSYPGDAGVPTTVKLAAPDGFVVNAWRYPVPVRFEQPGDIVGYGYTDRVMLIAQVQAPRELPTGESVSFAAVASWLACQDVCVPGRANLKLVLSTGQTGKPANIELFNDWMRRLPVPQDSPASPVAEVKTKNSMEARGQASSSQPAAGTLTVTIRWKRPPRDVQWFPQPPDGLAVENIRVETQADRTRIDLRPRVLAGQVVDSRVLPSVLAYRDAEGRLRGISLPIHLQNSDGQP